MTLGVEGRAERLRLAIAVPTYNEAESLPHLVEHLEVTLAGLPGVSTTLFVIDDHSPDGTGKAAEELAASGDYPHLCIRVLHRERKEGLGRAYVAGFSYILEQDDFDLVLQMDADLSHDPKYLPAMLDRSRTARLVVGSRYIPGGATPDWAWYRKLVSRLGNLYTRAFLGSRITDYTGGFNLFSADLLRSIDLANFRSEGYGFVIELKYVAAEIGDSVAQVPIVFMDRRVGASKIPRNTILKNLTLVPAVRFRPRTAMVRPAEYEPSPRTVIPHG